MIAGRICATCVFWDSGDNPTGSQASTSRCRRHAPPFIQHAHTGIVGVEWPKMRPHDWCGEHMMPSEFEGARIKLLMHSEKEQ